jgi:15-cis-phytoene synthase
MRQLQTMPDRPELPATRALARLYSLPPQRAVLDAVTRIEAEIEASVRPGVAHEVAHARLAWWREECARCAQGRAQHPLTRALTASLPGRLDLLAGLNGLTDIATWDLAQATFESRRELSAYCQRWGAAVITPLLGQAGADASAADSIGAPLRELELLLALVPDARAGRMRVPLDELARSAAPPAALARPPYPAALAGLLATRHRALRQTLGAAVAALPVPLQQQARGLLVWIALTRQHSLRAERALPAAAPGCDHGAALDGWRAWRAARRVTAGLGLSY